MKTIKKRPVRFDKTELDIQPYKPFMGHDETISHFDVKGVCLSKEFTNILLKKNLSRFTMTGPQIAALLQVGTRVMRGKDWKWGDQDRGSTIYCIGTVTTIPEDFSTAWVQVKWDN